MNCCHLSTNPAPANPSSSPASWRNSWRSAGKSLHTSYGSLGSGLLLVLLPKCPLCIAAWLTLFTGASVAVTIATRLRPLVEIVFAACVLLLLLRLLRARYRGFYPVVPCSSSSNVGCADSSGRQTGCTSTRSRPSSLAR